MRHAVVLVAACTALALPARAEDVRPRPAPLSGWRTVVIPQPLTTPWGTLTVTLGTRPPPPSERIETAALPQVRPLIGPAHALTGVASYYWQEQMTSSGERFDKNAMTAAHRTLPLGTRVRVTHLTSGRFVVVRINDRGPFKPGRVIDLSQAAAEHLGMTTHGLAQVRIDVVR